MHRKLFFLSLCVLLFPVPDFASKRAFTIEDLYRLHGIEELDVSPDGKIIVFALRDDDLPRAKRIRHLWLMDSNG